MNVSCQSDNGTFIYADLCGLSCNDWDESDGVAGKCWSDCQLYVRLKKKVKVNHSFIYLANFIIDFTVLGFDGLYCVNLNQKKIIDG